MVLLVRGELCPRTYTTQHPGIFPQRKANIMTAISIATAATTMVADIFAFRSAAITSENKATPMARSILASMLAGVATVATIEATVLKSFRNPVGKSGKALTKLNSSGDHLPGFGATRKTIADIFYAYDNREQGDKVLPILTGFVLNEADAPKSLRALKLAVQEAVKAHVAETTPEAPLVEGEASTDEAPKADGADVPAPAPLADRVNALTVAMNAASDADLNDAYEAFNALFAAFNARIDAATGADEGEEVREAA